MMRRYGMGALQWIGFVALSIAVYTTLNGCREKESKNGAAESAAAEQALAHEDNHGVDATAGEHSDEIELSADAIARYGIRVETAEVQRLQPSFTAAARVAFNSEAMAHVGSPLPGRVIELRVKLGDNVQKGDTLLIVESPELGEAQSDFLGKQIAAKAGVATIELAKNALDRANRLYEQNRGIALDEVQKREAEFKSAQTTLLTAQSAATAAENKLHLLGMDQVSVERLRESGEVNPRFPIGAPIPGQVVEREITLGELVHPEKETLLILADVDTFWVLADVPEARLAEVALGAGAWMNAGSLDPHRHEGQISYIAPMVDPRTRTATVRVVVKCDDRSLKPGMFVQVHIASVERGDTRPAEVVAVPEESVQTIDGQPVVFVAVPNEQNTFVKRPVSTGKSVGGLVPILVGLKPGEFFVANGSFMLKAELGKGSAEHGH